MSTDKNTPAKGDENKKVEKLDSRTAEQVKGGQKLEKLIKK